LFVAIQGAQSDGHTFIPQAIAKGASAIVTDDPAIPTLAQVAHVCVPGARAALSAIAATFYGDPSHEMDVVGVTGTNGKTTTTQMLAAMCDAAGMAAGVIGTVGGRLGTREWRLGNTTPLPHELHAVLAQMRHDGARAIAMEVSSHALVLGRVDDMRFAIGALTNVTRDHLDFHGTLDAYAQAKRRLFDVAERCVFNISDAYGERWAREMQASKPVSTYALAGTADLVPGDVTLRADGSSFDLDGTKFEVRLAGRFNVANALCAIACARLLGIADADAARALASVDRVPGRMEHVRGGDIDVIVDYAHTPDSLENVLQALRETTTGGLAVVFGCGGDRDRGKRPLMGEVAAQLADRVYVTSDNPRTEDPQAIVDAIAIGIGNRAHVIEVDRARAIARAIAEARPRDTVLIAGKGHEAYQIIGADVLPFDDVAVAREALAARART
jgi:UDP-N-acetylmuramoyl-L-alanyl-D-glutamate--2,6-diaminopimelate ligase